MLGDGEIHHIDQVGVVLRHDAAHAVGGEGFIGHEPSGAEVSNLAQASEHIGIAQHTIHLALLQGGHGSIQGVERHRLGRGLQGADGGRPQGAAHRGHPSTRQGGGAAIDSSRSREQPQAGEADRQGVIHHHLPLPAEGNTAGQGRAACGDGLHHGGGVVNRHETDPHLTAELGVELLVDAATHLDGIAHRFTLGIEAQQGGGIGGAHHHQFAGAQGLLQHRLG